MTRSDEPRHDDAEQAAAEPLPDLTQLDLKDLEGLRHPVLSEVLAELRERAERPGEALWGWNNSFT
ncbi:FxSxx-COOH cyclophane-containing RiPP peptide [Streptomyces sp. UC4497]